jgi:hypothetical protein
MTLAFGRHGHPIEILLPADAWAFHNATKLFATKTNPEGGTLVHVVQVRVFGTAPVSSDGEEESAAYDERLDFIKETYPVAENACADFIEWVRLGDQPWLGLHRQRPIRVGWPVVCDERAEYTFGNEILPSGDPPPRERPGEAAISPAGIASAAAWLGGAGGVLPIGEALLADALHFAWSNPSDLQRAVLMAAIACEVKVKETLHERAAAELRPLLDVILGSPRDWSVAAVGLFDKPMHATLNRSLKSESAALYKGVGRLFELRNRIAHRGEKPLDGAGKEAVAAARDVFRWLDSL